MTHIANPLGNPKIAEYGAKTRFQPGNPGGGRPPGTGPAALQAKLEKYLNLDTDVILPDGSHDKRSVIDATVLALLHKATRGDIPAIKELFDRHYGKLTDKVELTGKDGQPLEINHGVRLQEACDALANSFTIAPADIVPGISQD